MGNFSASVSVWVGEQQERMTAVFRESASRTIADAQTPIAHGGNMPVRTGFLRASGRAAIGEGLPALVSHPGGGAFAYEGAEVNMVISNAQLGDTVTFAYAANYAAAQEYGAHGREGHRFVGLAAQKWPQTVAVVSAEAETRAGK